jgi:hypothetical protein
MFGYTVNEAKKDTNPWWAANISTLANHEAMKSLSPAPRPHFHLQALA